MRVLSHYVSENSFAHKIQHPIESRYDRGEKFTKLDWSDIF